MTWPRPSASRPARSPPRSSAWPTGGLVDHRPYHGVRFTPAGRRLAVAAIRRHRIVERFLADMLGYPWNEADRLAPTFEHDLPDEVTDRLFVALNRPATCPHGFPIPEPEQDEIPAPAAALRASRPATSPRWPSPAPPIPRWCASSTGSALRPGVQHRGPREAPVRRSARAAGGRPRPHPRRAGGPPDLRATHQHASDPSRTSSTTTTATRPSTMRRHARYDQPVGSRGGLPGLLPGQHRVGLARLLGRGGRHRPDPGLHPDARRAGQGRRHRRDAGDRRRHPGGGERLPPAPVPHHRRDRGAAGRRSCSSPPPRSSTPAGRWR